MKPYTAIADLAGFLLEDSYVLDIHATPGQLDFRTDFVLTPEHGAYRGPRSGEQHDYRRGCLSFLQVTHLTWAEQGLPPAVDARGEKDYGTFDSFEWADHRYVVVGSFGSIDVRAGIVRAQLADEAS
ncbi:hypothetical protein [Conexibacter sp. SYSU D00693]|uniref:hypothetical protein n=1 Tax=Conexibacter sp. SYSU D00693 TaxID=2812560 RepID=UPI00196B426E|nr:hypothetical protein [Conexibacter sp. SYSU D00693]